MDLSLETAGIGLAWYLVFVLSTTLHEAAHAWTALKLGDPTAYLGGQVTLNPRPHLEREPVGMIVVPVLTFLLGGWMMGWASAPYDPHWALRHPRRAAWMALAGPVANLLLVLLAAVVIRIGVAAEVFAAPERTSISQITVAHDEGLARAAAVLVSILFMQNLVLLVFNLLPLPPLDGSGALPLMLPPPVAERYLEFMRQPMLSLLGLAIAWKLFDVVFDPFFMLALNLLYPGMHYRAVG